MIGSLKPGATVWVFYRRRSRRPGMVVEDLGDDRYLVRIAMEYSLVSGVHRQVAEHVIPKDRLRPRPVAPSRGPR